MPDSTQSDSTLQARKNVFLRLPPELVEEVDTRARRRNISRNEWFERMARWVIENKD